MQEHLSILHQNAVSSPETTSEFGSRGEALAAGFLRSNGYRIVMANFKVPVGRNSRGAQVTGEIDLIALDGETLCFVEVKTRRSEEFTPVLTAVDLRKQRQITRTARIYRRIFGVMDLEHRYDVVTVLLRTGAEPVIELRKAFWNEGRFKKQSWGQPPWREYI